MNKVNTRELILGVLLEVTRDGVHSHLALRGVLDKYQYLDKTERNFITRVTEGTLERMIELDYIINQFSKTKVNKIKPVIRNILRSAVYQLKYMDSVPASAACNEAVKLAERKGFRNLKAFVNGVLRNINRGLANVVYPSEEEGLVRALSVRYSMPEWIIEKLMKCYSEDEVKQILISHLEEVPLTIRNRMETKGCLTERLEGEGVQAEQHPYLSCAFQVQGIDYIGKSKSFEEGLFAVQDVSSMLAAHIADPAPGSYCIDICAAPGGKSIHLADKLEGSGMVEARDLTDYKVSLIEENIARCNVKNIKTVKWDALAFDKDSVEKADVVIADVPCSGLGVLRKKTDVKYNLTEVQVKELVKLQKDILDTVWPYVKKGGVLVYSTCTVLQEENMENKEWFEQNYPFKPMEIDSYLPGELKGKTTAEGCLQLLPGVHESDGFFIAKFRRMD